MTGRGMSAGADPDPDPSVRLLPPSAVLAGLVLLLVAATATTLVLLQIADGAPKAKRAELRIEAIKTGLTVGAGVGGIGTILLAVRRQWLAEIAQIHSQHDAVESRVTELYTKAVDQLGSSVPAVQFGGLYALERLAESEPVQAQGIINVLCAFVRSTEATSRGAQAAALSVLAEHLRRDTPPNECSASNTHWHDASLNLILARIISIALDGHIGAFDAQGLDCEKDAVFTHSRFAGDVDCRWIQMHRYFDFSGVEVCGSASFLGATFDGFTEFDDCIFHGPAVFGGATFKQHADFKRAHFRGAAHFREATFERTAPFEGCTFEGDVLFDEDQSSVDLRGARVTGDLSSRIVSLPTGWHLRVHSPWSGEIERL